MDWQPIETAPKDGRILLLYGAGRDFFNCQFIGYCNHNQVWKPFPLGDEVCQPTHWMAAPDQPSQTPAEEQS